MALSVHLAVAERLNELSDGVGDKVADLLAAREVNKRCEALVTAIDKLDKMEREHRKHKADLVSYDTDGRKVIESWSKAALEERNKSQQKIDKATKAINKALDDKDFSDVYTFVNSKDDGGKEG